MGPRSRAGPAMPFQFGEFELSVERYELRHNGVVLHVEPLVFDLISVLAANPGRVVTREEIVERVWQGRAVSGGNDRRLREVRPSGTRRHRWGESVDPNRAGPGLRIRNRGQGRKTPGQPRDGEPPEGSIRSR